MGDFGKSNKMIKINGKMAKPTLTTNSAILIFRSLLKKELLKNENVFYTIAEPQKIHFQSEEVLFSIKNEISKLLNPL